MKTRLLIALCALVGFEFVSSVTHAQDAQVPDAEVSADGGMQQDAGLAAFTPGPWAPPPPPTAIEELADEPPDEAEVSPAEPPPSLLETVPSDAPTPAEPSPAPPVSIEEEIALPTAFEEADAETVGSSELPDLVSVVVDESYSPATYWGWLFLALLAWLLERTLRKRSTRFSATGLLPSLLSVASLLWRGSVFMAILFFSLRVVPTSWLPDLKWVVLGGALVVVWSVRGVLTDVVARLVIALDGKVRPRLMVQTPQLTGRVARVGLRKTDVVDAIGRTWAIPNRRLLSAQVREPSETHVHASLTLSVPDKRVIEDAALASAWIHPNGTVHVWRDESNPNLWHVETELISHDYERVFRSDIAERVRDYLLNKVTFSHYPDTLAPDALEPRSKDEGADTGSGQGG